MSNNKGFVQNKASDIKTGTAREGSNTSTERSTGQIPVIEEKLQVSKEVVEKGGFRINKKVHTEDVTVEMPVNQEEMEIERVPVNQYIDSPPPAVRHEGDTMIVPVLKEVVVKRLVLVEEIHITKRRHQKQSETEVTLRKEEVDIERINKENK